MLVGLEVFLIIKQDCGVDSQYLFSDKHLKMCNFNSGLIEILLFKLSMEL